MGVFRGRRLVFIAALSLALHAMVLAWLAWPTRPDFFANGPDLSLMSVELLRPSTPRPRPAVKPAAGPAAGPAPAVRTRDVQAVAPIPAGVAAVPAPPGPAPGPPAVPDSLRAALRAGAGCARATSREAREACAERLGRLAPGTPSYDTPMDPAKRAYFDAVAAAGAVSGTYGDPKPGGANPDGDYFRLLNCSVTFGVGRKEKDRQGMARLGRTPCYVPLQGSVVTPEASIRKR